MLLQAPRMARIRIFHEAAPTASKISLQATSARVLDLSPGLNFFPSTGLRRSHERGRLHALRSPRGRFPHRELESKELKNGTEKAPRDLIAAMPCILELFGFSSAARAPSPSGEDLGARGSSPCPSRAGGSKAEAQNKLTGGIHSHSTEDVAM